MPRIVDHQQRRALIAQASADIIAEHGLEQATMREIAARAGVSKGIVEHYFANKEDVIGAALEWANQRYRERESRHVGGRQGIEALRARLRCALPLTTESRREWRIRLRFWSLAAFEPQVQAEQRVRLMSSRALFAEDIRQAVARGELPAALDCARAAEQLMHMVAGVSCNALLDAAHYPRRHLLALVEDALDSLRNAP